MKTDAGPRPDLPERVLGAAVHACLALVLPTPLVWAPETLHPFAVGKAAWSRSLVAVAFAAWPYWLRSRHAVARRGPALPRPGGAAVRAPAGGPLPPDRGDQGQPDLPGQVPIAMVRRDPVPLRTARSGRQGRRARQEVAQERRTRTGAPQPWIRSAKTGGCQNVMLRRFA